ncbi:hypothetical protein INQ23_29595, partial [Escherichia coli]|nr:hypothetical protein [Escherichia coli]
MFRKAVLALALPALFVTSAAAAQQAGPTPGPKSGEPATIPFLTRNDIRTFESTDDG